MQSALNLDDLETVSATVQFTVKTGEMPVALVHEPGDGLDERSGRFEEREVLIHDARPLAGRTHLDREGFSLLRRDTAVVDFYDDDEVRRVYYPEMDALLKEQTGAAKVVIFDHTQRIDDGAQQDARALRPPAKVVHNDFTIDSAERRVRDLLPPDEAEARLGKRYASINVWRPIRGPVQTAPLLICAWDDIADDDLIVAERHYPDGRVGSIYQMAYNPSQRWLWFPRMQRDEIVLLKCYDSLTDGTARWTAHGAFWPRQTPADAPPRESIEIRSLIFFD